mgnify:CR=1 FL=1
MCIRDRQYARYIDDSYSAMEKTNFYDAVYSPVILILNAIVVAVVMLLSASENPTVLKLFGMSAGTAVAVINYISQIFTPVESLGMEIQTIQSAFAGMERINEFYSLKEKKASLKAIDKEIVKLEAKKEKADAKAAEEAKKAEAEAVLKKLLAEGMNADEILAKLK